MNYVYGILAAAVVLGALGWLYKLIQNNKELKRLLDNVKYNEVIKEWDDKISKQSDRVKESEIDYAKEKQDFIDKHSNDGKPE